MMSARSSPPLGVVFWFRNDLRLHDQGALREATRRAQSIGGWLLPVFVHDPAQQLKTAWGFPRAQPRRQVWLNQALDGVTSQLQNLGSTLLRCHGDPVQVLSHLVAQLGHPHLVCEEIAAPEERAVVQALRHAGVTVHTVWQSSLLDPATLPFAPGDVPDAFTAFRQAIEKVRVEAPAPLPPPRQLPPPPISDLQRASASLPIGAGEGVGAQPGTSSASRASPDDPRTAFPLHEERCHGGELAALAHLRWYCERGLPHSYKATRNGLVGLDYSSKWSPWLATGALSARQAWAQIAAFERDHGATQSTYWLWFELLWRDHFRFLHLKHGTKLYRAGGLSEAGNLAHNPEAFERWCKGLTGHPFIDAGMRELSASGYLSNRMRQNVASYLIHDLQCDWRAGAAWFESQLIDYDVYSNQGNWLYLSGRGTDPRGSRRFDPDKQARDYDPDGAYRRLWASVPT